MPTRRTATDRLEGYDAVEGPILVVVPELTELQRIRVREDCCFFWSVGFSVTANHALGLQHAAPRIIPPARLVTGRSRGDVVNNALCCETPLAGNGRGQASGSKRIRGLGKERRSDDALQGCGGQGFLHGYLVLHTY